jgi:hypothetical protein
MMVFMPTPSDYAKIRTFKEMQVSASTNEQKVGEIYGRQVCSCLCTYGLTMSHSKLVSDCTQNKTLQAQILRNKKLSRNRPWRSIEL